MTMHILNDSPCVQLNVQCAGLFLTVLAYQLSCLFYGRSLSYSQIDFTFFNILHVDN